MQEVELSVTVWERTWRSTLTRAFFEGITASVGRGFDRVTVTVNNVDSPVEVRDRFAELSGIVDASIWVTDALPAALAATGLSPRRLEPLPHYTDHFLVKITAPGPRWLVHWDTDVVLTQPGDWVTPSVDLLSQDDSVAVAGPGWTDEASMTNETVRQEGPFNLGYGFTDHIFMVDRIRLRNPIYRHVCPASWWYPTSHLTPIFEQRVDAWMRRNRLLRATYRDVRYQHTERMADQPAEGTWQRLNRKVRRAAFDQLQRLPESAPPYLRRL